MNAKRMLVLLALGVFLLSGCSKAPISDDEETTTEVTNGVITPLSKDDAFTDRDQRDTYEEIGAAYIKLNGTSATSTSDAVTISGSTVTITDEGTYILSGTLTNGRIVVNADENDKPQLVLNGVSVTSATSAALYILESDKVVVTLADGTENALANGGAFTAVDENNIDGAVFSKQDLTFNGRGTLVVKSPADHGIVCKDDLVFTGGTYTVTSASHGLDANDSIRLADSSITVDAGKDGFHAENDDDDTIGFVYIASGVYTIESEGDGISGGAYVQMDGGAVNILAGGGSANAQKQTSDSWGGFMGGGGMMPPGGRSSQTTSTTSSEDSTSIKGIKSAGNVLINGGTVKIDSADDAIHANASITVGGGTFDLTTGDDGFHADDTLTMKEGKITIRECYEGLEALHVNVAGGTVNLTASDDGINAAGGTDSSGTGGARPGGDRFGGHGGMGGMGGSSSNGSVTVSGGTLHINSSGDGIDANGTLTISGGYTVVVGPTQGDTATLDYDVSGAITGGTFIGTGALGMAQTFSDSEQGVVAVSVGNQPAGTLITVKDISGKTLISHEPELSFAVVILSSPDLQKGEDYTITVGSFSDTFKAS